jgi:ATP-dependent Clp protease protease subunit
MIHQPSGGARGQETDILIQADEIKKCRAELEEIMAGYTKQKLSKIHADCERDNYMTSAQAKEYGLIDKVVSRESETEAKNSKKPKED